MKFMILTSCKQVYWPWGGTTFSSPFISTLILSLMAPDTADLSVLLSAKYPKRNQPWQGVPYIGAVLMPTCVLLKFFRKETKEILFCFWLNVIRFKFLKLSHTWIGTKISDAKSSQQIQFKGLLSNQWTDTPEWNRDHIYRNKMTRIDWTGCNCIQFTGGLPHVQVWKLIHIHIMNYIFGLVST